MLTLTYIALAGLGCVYILGSMLLGHYSDFGSDAGGHAGGDAHAAADGDTGAYGVTGSGHGDVSAGGGAAAAFHFPFFSPLALATLSATFGGLGLIARHGLALRDGASLLVAAPGALALTYAVTYASWRLVSGSRGTSMLRDADFAGVPAEVLTPIPAGGVGEVAAMLRGERFTAPAREVRGRAVARGARITVVRRIGFTLEVSIGPEGG